MARRRKRDSGGSSGGGDWLNTYADMVTLLLTFFILLFSMSTLDSARFNMLVTAFASERDSDDRIIIRGDTTGQDTTGSLEIISDPEDVDNLDDIFDYLQSIIAEQDLSGSMEVAQGDNYVFIRFMNDLLFLPDGDTLLPQAQEIIDQIGIAIKQIQDDVESISIVGHTADMPEIEDYPVNDRILSTNRANQVLIRFEEVVGIDPPKLFATSYGKWKPLPGADNTTEETRSPNRRVEIYISAEKGVSLGDQLDNVYEKLVE